MNDLAQQELLQHVLVPLDGSEASRAALVPARRLLLGAPNPSLTLLEVVEAVDAERAERERGAALARLKNELDEERQRTQRLSRRLGSGVRPPRLSPLVEHGRPAQRILEVSNRSGADTVAMTTHGRSGLDRLVRGSVAEEVLRQTPLPLLVSTPGATRLAGPGEPFLRVLVPLDGSVLAYQALPLAATVARRGDAEVVLVRVGAGDDGCQGCLEHAAERLIGEYGLSRVVRDMVAPAPPAQALLAATERHRVDLVVMTTHGRSGFDRLRLGSVAEELLRRSPCPVLIRRGE